MSMENLEALRTHPVLMQAATVVGAGLVVLYALYHSMLPKPIPGIPYNEESARRILGDLPIIAAIKQAGGRRKLFWGDLARKHQSPVVQFFFGLGTKPGVIIADYREASDILLRRSKEVFNGAMNVNPWLGLAPGHILSMDDSHPKFKYAKSLGKDLMAPSFLHSVSGPASYEMVKSLIDLWQFKAKKAGGLPFDAAQDLSLMTFDIMETAAFGTSQSKSSTVRSLSELQRPNMPSASGCKLADFPKPEKVPELLEAVHAFEEAANGALSNPNSRLYHFLNNNFNPRIRKAVRVKEQILRSYIRGSVERLGEGPAHFKPRSATDCMVSREAQAAAKAGTTPAFYSQHMRDGLLGYIVAGHDSTTSTLCFMSKRLGSNQGIQHKLRQSLYEAYPELHSKGQQPNAEEISKTQIPYLDAFIQEVLRADPPGALTTRETACDMNVLGYVIPKNTTVLFVINGPTLKDRGCAVPEELRSETSGKREGFADWADSPHPPEEFIPERWLRLAENGAGTAFDGAAGPFLTFGRGKRGCWGQRLAQLELKLITTLLVWNFQFESLPAGLHDWEVDENDIFAKPKNTLVKIRSLPDN